MNKLHFCANPSKIFFHISFVSEVIPAFISVENSTANLITFYVSFHALISPIFSLIPSQSYVLSNGLTPTFKVISHEYHAQQVSRKYSPLYSTLHFKYPPNQSRVEMGSNTSTVALRVIGGQEKGT
jgi:hypothetical protein